MLSLTAENRADLKKFGRFLSAYRRRIALVTFTMLVSIVVQLPLPFLTMMVIDRLVKSQDVSIVPLVCSGLAFFALFAALVSLGHTLVLAILREHVLGTLELELIERLQHTRMSFFHQHPSSYLASRIHSDLRNLNALLVGALLSALQNALLVLSAAVSLLVLSWRLGLFTLGCVPLLVLAVVGFNRGLRATSQVVQEAAARFASGLQESLANIQLVKAFGAESTMKGRLRRQLLHLVRHVIRQEMLGAVVQRCVSLVGTVLPLLMMWFGVGEITAGRLSIGQFVAFNSFLAYIFGPLLALLSQNVQVQSALTSLRRVMEILELPGEAPRDVVGLLPPRSDLRFESVAFEYRPELPVLTSIDLSVSEGETVALVGPSGEGKTTLLRLLLRFHEPSQGVLRLGGADVRSLPLSGYRSRFAVVFQEPLLFNGTVEENLRIANPLATRQQIDEALAVACAADFVAALPQGCQTILGEAGAKLSAGQKMRLAIARAVLKDAPIVLLDEATSALDWATERLVLENLRRYLRGRTALLVAHHASAVDLASRVCSLQGGAVAESVSREAYLRSLDAGIVGGPALERGAPSVAGLEL